MSNVESNNWHTDRQASRKVGLMPGEAWAHLQPFVLMSVATIPG